jgi:hypothetical protein
MLTGTRTYHHARGRPAPGSTSKPNNRKKAAAVVVPPPTVMPKAKYASSVEIASENGMGAPVAGQVVICPQAVGSQGAYSSSVSSPAPA